MPSVAEGFYQGGSSEFGAWASAAGAHKLRNSYAPVGSSGATRFDDENGAAGGGYSSDGLYNGGRGAHQVAPVKLC